MSTKLEDRVAQLEAERESYLRLSIDNANECRRLGTENNRLRTALRKYGGHYTYCLDKDGLGCDCGFDAALADSVRSK